MARELHKGQAIYVEGYVSSRSFTTARGDKRTAVEIYAEQIQILGPFVAEERQEGAAAEHEIAAASPGAAPRSGHRPREEAARPAGAGEPRPPEPVKETAEATATSSPSPDDASEEQKKKEEAGEAQLSLSDSVQNPASPPATEPSSDESAEAQGEEESKA
jgi:single-stranded DNA-binding protein